MVNRKVVSLLFLIVLSSCLPVTHRSLNKLDMWSPKKKVIKVMGKPYSTSGHYNKEIMVYYVHEDIFDLFFSKKFPFVGIYPLTRTGTEYWLVLEKGYLVSYGKAEYYNINKDQGLFIKQN